MPIRKLLPHPLISVVLLVCWLWLNDTAAAGQVALGLLLGLAIPLFTRRFWPATQLVRMRAVPGLLALLLFDIVVANLQTARLILGPAGRLRSGFVRVPLALRTGRGIAILIGMISVTPGTVAAELARDRSWLLVHYLSSDDPEALVHRLKGRYERRIREIFEC
jgi:multicomponent K+:H+ antiporter subunit E